MKSAKKTLVLILLLTMGVLLPNTLVYAQRNQEPVRIATSPPVEFIDNSETMPNGLIKVDWEIKFIWYYEDSEIGYAWQYVSGVQKTNGMATLIGYGEFTSTDTDLPGTITYTIGNNWDLISNEIWAFRMRVVGGTGSFDGIKGTAVADFPDFLLYLNFNPWE